MQREADRLEITKRYLAGQTQNEIALALGMTQNMVCLDLKAVRQEWAREYASDINEAKCRELAKVDHLERTYWDAWERSCQPGETKTLQENAGQKRAVIQQQKRDGNPVYLQGVMQCIERRCKILGVDAPEKSDTSNITRIVVEYVDHNIESAETASSTE